jgi:hypothetical protein
LNIASEYGIIRNETNQNGLKLNGAHLLLVYADGCNILGGRIHTIKKNTEALVVAGKQIGVEVNSDTTKCMKIF